MYFGQKYGLKNSCRKILKINLNFRRTKKDSVLDLKNICSYKQKSSNHKL